MTKIKAKSKKSKLKRLRRDISVNLRSPGARTGIISATVSLGYTINNCLDTKYATYIKVGIVVLSSILFVLTVLSIFSAHKVANQVTDTNTFPLDKGDSEDFKKAVDELSEISDKLESIKSSISTYESSKQ